MIIMEHKHAAKLILENIQILEESVKLLEGEITETFISQVETIIENHISPLDDNWSGTFEFIKNGFIAFSPETWLASKPTNNNYKFQDYYARYTLTSESAMLDIPDNHWWISSFIKDDKERMIFTFYPWFDNFKKLKKKRVEDFCGRISS